MSVMLFNVIRAKFLGILTHLLTCHFFPGKNYKFLLGDEEDWMGIFLDGYDLLELCSYIAHV